MTEVAGTMSDPVTVRTIKVPPQSDDLLPPCSECEALRLQLVAQTAETARLTQELETAHANHADDNRRHGRRCIAAEAALTALTARHEATVTQLRTAYDNMRAAEMRAFGAYVEHCGRAGKETQALVDTVARLSGGEKSGT